MKHRGGYTVMEVLISAAIFSVVMLLIFGTYQLTLKITKQGREVSIASNLADQMVDAIRVQSFEDITVNASPTAVATTKLPNGFTKTFVSLYQDNDKIKEVRVIVYWEGRPETNALTLTTLVSQGGINSNELEDAEPEDGSGDGDGAGDGAEAEVDP